MRMWYDYGEINRRAAARGKDDIMLYRINAPEKFSDPKAQEFLELLRRELMEAYEKYHENPKNKHVAKAAERFNMFMNIYID